MDTNILCASVPERFRKERKFTMMKITMQTVTGITLVILLLTACAAPANPTVAPTTQTIQTQTMNREAQVQSVEIQITGSDPAQVNAIVRGKLTESCAMLGESQVQYDSTMIRITVYAVSRTDISCAQTTTPFETTIPLHTKD